MKEFKNTSRQGLSIPFSTPQGVRYIYFTPKSSLELPDNWTSNVAESLVVKRLFKIRHVAQPQPVSVVTTSLNTTRSLNKGKNSK